MTGSIGVAGPSGAGGGALPDLEALDVEALRRRRSTKWSAYPGDVLPAWVAEMDYPLAEPVRAALREAVDAGDCGYAYPAPLGPAFAAWAGRRLGWDVDPARVRAVPDVMVGVAEVLRVMTRPGDPVVVNPPVYPPFFAVVGEVGRRVVEVPLLPPAAGTAPDGSASTDAPAGSGGDGWRLDLDGLERAFAAGARAYLLCNPHNPVGRAHSAAELAAVAELAERYGVLVLSDEIHAPLGLSGHQVTPYLTVSRSAAANGVAFHSASKAWNIPGLKCALVVTAGDQAAAGVAAMPEEVSYRTGHLGVVASVAAFTDGDPWLDAVRDKIAANAALLSGLLAERLPGVRYRPGEAGYLAWLDCRALGLGDDPARAFRLRGKVALSPGPTFGTPGLGFARLNIATSAALLTEAVSRMASVSAR